MLADRLARARRSLRRRVHSDGFGGALDRAGRLAVRLLPAIVRRKAVWWFVRLTQPRFLVGVCSVLRSPDGRILLLEHRFWEGQKWGVPSGHMEPSETPERTAARELREECGLEVENLRVVHVEAGTENRVELWLVGEVDIDEAPHKDALDSREIQDAALLNIDDALERLHRTQASVLRRVLEKESGEQSPGA